MKYADLLQQKLGVEVQKMDEIECVVRGCNFLLNHIPDEAFSFQKDASVGNKKIYHTFEDAKDTYPYLLVNIGSGVSIICIKVRTSCIMCSLLNLILRIKVNGIEWVELRWAAEHSGDSGDF